MTAAQNLSFLRFRNTSPNPVGFIFYKGREKKWQTEHRTAQPPTLATFRSWGSSAGAGRADLPVRIYN